MIYDLEDVSFAYEADQRALAGVTLKVAPGERIALLGANGSGKSTLMRLLDALSFPTAGRMSAAGQALSEQAFADEAVGLCLEGRYRYGHRDGHAAMLGLEFTSLGLDTSPQGRKVFQTIVDKIEEYRRAALDAAGANMSKTA